MGEIVGAGIVSHVPTIMLPEETRLEINDGKEITLVPGLRRLRTEVLDRLEADTFVVMDTHWEVTFEHIITGHEKREGIFTSHELPRGMRQIPYEMPGDPELAFGVSEQAEGPRRHVGARLRRPVPPDLLRHGEHLVLPEGGAGELGERRHQPVRDDRGLPAPRAADRGGRAVARPQGGAVGERRAIPPVPARSVSSAAARAPTR